MPRFKAWMAVHSFNGTWTNSVPYPTKEKAEEHCDKFVAGDRLDIQIIPFEFNATRQPLFFRTEYEEVSEVCDTLEASIRASGE